MSLIGPAPPTVSAKARAAALACGHGAVVSHRTAAVVWELVRVRPEPELHVTVAGRNPGVKPDIRIHRPVPAPIIGKLLSQENETGYTRSQAERRLRDLIRAADLDTPLFSMSRCSGS